jgi:hypothetical protein
MADLEKYTRYYLEQAGNGMNVFRGARYQRGHGGIGSFLKGLLRMAMPLFKSGARAVGQEALRAGANILGDISSDRPVRQVFKDRLREAGHALHARAAAGVSRMSGNGRLKGVKRRRKTQSGGKAKRIRTSVARKRVRKTVKKKKRKIVKKKKKKPKKRVVRKTKGNKKSVRTLRDIFS